MSGRRLRSILEPVLYLGIAALLHSALFLIPSGAPVKKEAVTTQRGVRVRAFVDRPAPPVAVANPSFDSKPPPDSPKALEQPPEVAEKNFSVLGSRTANGDSMSATTQAGGAKGTGNSSVEAGGAGGAGVASPASRAQDGSPPQTEFGKYLASIKSSNVQGWAKDSANKSRQGWKGTAGSGTGEGWGPGSGSGSGAGAGAGRGAGGSGSGKSGYGTGGNGALYMDPRVQLVVTSYPSTGIDRRHGQIPYPNLKFKQSKYTSGWWNVYIKVRVSAAGVPVNMEVLRPETDGPLEKQFLDQVKREVGKWDFDAQEAEVHVDVRFYVE